MKNNKTLVAVSGGFDPIHIGHVRLFQEAKGLRDKLVVMLNDDHSLRAKKLSLTIGHGGNLHKKNKEVILC